MVRGHYRRSGRGRIHVLRQLHQGLIEADIQHVPIAANSNRARSVLQRLKRNNGFQSDIGIGLKS